jgi:hypothetical protein
LEPSEKLTPKESKSLCFIEMAYPPDPGLASQEIARKPIFRVEYYKNFINIVIPNYKFDEDKIPEALNVERRVPSAKYVHVLLRELDQSIMNYLKSLILNDYKHYTSSGINFGCCSSFNECSNKKGCVHANLLYSKKCTYRMNLEQGKIFYGVNRNV